MCLAADSRRIARLRFFSEYTSDGGGFSVPFATHCAMPWIQPTHTSRWAK